MADITKSKTQAKARLQIAVVHALNRIAPGEALSNDEEALAIVQAIEVLIEAKMNSRQESRT
jgi:hypothetical protein